MHRHLPLCLSVLLLIAFRVIGTADVTATRTFKIEKDNYSVDETGTFSRQQLELAVPHF